MKKQYIKTISVKKGPEGIGFVHEKGEVTWYDEAGIADQFAGMSNTGIVPEVWEWQGFVDWTYYR